MTEIHRPLRLNLDASALVQNWTVLSQASGGAATGAAVKANGYGLGAREVVKLLSRAGCADFFVANWAEALAISDLVPNEQIAVLNGVQAEDLAAAAESGIAPVLNSPLQIARWKQAGGGRCHVMLDSGINRLGIGPDQADAALFDGLQIDILLSHLASADEDVPQNARQQSLFCAMSAGIPCQRRSLANSAGIQLGADYHFDLTRPGISIYGGIERPELADALSQVVTVEAQLLQVRTLKRGDSVGYGATFVCPNDMRVGTIAIGYADGYLRGFSNRGRCFANGVVLPVVGRISMDLTIVDLSNATVGEGDWIDVDFHLSTASAQSGLSQYELLTSLGSRFTRHWS